MSTEQSTGEIEQLAPEVDNEVDPDQEDEIELAENPHEEGQKILKQLAEKDRDNIFAAVSGGTIQLSPCISPTFLPILN